MRIIAGEHRGRRIEAPRGLSTRPMLDRVREALFSSLGARVDEARVLDLFAGSGSLGLEALSRGALSVRMIDRDPEALRVLRANVELLRVEERAEIVRGDALEPRLWTPVDPAGLRGPYVPPGPSGSHVAQGSQGSRGPMDIVFLDPPYAMVEDRAGQTQLVERIERLLREVVAPGGILVLHAEKRRARDLSEAHPTWDLRVYGTSALLYIRKGEDDA